MLHSQNIKLLVIHCSDTENEKELEASDIHKMHLGFSWDGIGYHKVILRSGEIQNGRPEYWVGAHVKGKNDVSLGVCLIGRNHFTEKQYISLEKVLREWRNKYPNADILGHCDTGQTLKTCPNFNVGEWLKIKNI